MNNVRTVSDTKRDFYTHHTRPINSIYRRVVEELIVEMHLLSVNVDFNYDPIYALGVVTTFERFMQGYNPEADKDSIFSAICAAVGGDAQKYRQDAAYVLDFAKKHSGTELIDWLASPTETEGGEKLSQSLKKIAANPKFKYSRLFSIGLFTALEAADLELVQNEEKRSQALQKIAEGLNLSVAKIQKDLSLYIGNLEKVKQMLVVLEDTLEASRKQRQKRELEQQNKAAEEPKQDSD